jgi:hypothetical protein
LFFNDILNFFLIFYRNSILYSLIYLIFFYEFTFNRVRKAGGYISEGRINGNLNLSRAIGDLEYKKNTELKPSE